MGVREWSLRPAEIRRLDDDARRRFASRLVTRLEPWSPTAAAEVWAAAASSVASAVGSEATPGSTLQARVLTSAGGATWSALAGTPHELAGRCANHALTAVAALLELDILAGCRGAASIPAQRAHAGLTAEPVEVVAPAFWAVLRADLTAGADAALWPDGEPGWAQPTPEERAALDSDEVTTHVARALGRFEQDLKSGG